MLKNLYESLLKKVNEGSHCVMLTYLDVHGDKYGSISEKVLLTDEEIDKKSVPLSLDIYDKIELSLNSGKLQSINIEDNKILLIEPFVPKPRLFIFGCGHVAKPVAEFAARVGFSVIAIDDRPSFANKGRFPDADKVICENFENCFDLIKFKKSDYVVIVTRGHRYDGVVLRQVLKHDLTYMGMIGSRRRVRGMKEELISEGYSEEKLNTLHSPIGLDIGGVTPDEIAISIVAELISCKNKGTSFTFPEFDLEVANKISEEDALPKALITILSAKGSVPRKAGAKMIAYFDGRTVGSIGGGCSEAAVILKAREVMRKKGFTIEHVDMTGEVAESEGMVCGGVMEVLVEVF